ncbi:amino acid adenylation domain-containing protein [Methylococcus sp. EFPC2]|uniref:amino acid adenylation domain-containing protein n=1 Tax=Methylococcus sp. EFPC2 TaxID=2812648 RepID=UPI00196748FB|nr:amino acid adenylation domain-containing protein [Methylococcus sp. EFPC2]QSA98878.1 amino acid adenylation domain-containing protein [Methylococcus sp. EFPC2]
MLCERLLRQARQRPDALALVEGERQLSYGMLLERALAVTGNLQDIGIGAGDRVAIHLERGIDAVIAVFGVLLTGACYVPLDIKNPPSRRDFILSDAAVSAVIRQNAGASPVIDTVPPAQEPRRVDWNERQQIPAHGPAGKVDASDPAAILYTSGSTGRPKGVALSHGAIAAFADWAAERMELKPDDRIASSAPLFFDLSTFDLYAVLAKGASLHFVPGPLFLAPARLAAWLSEHRISGWYTVPALLAFLAYKGNLGSSPPASLRFLIFAGEAFPPTALKSLAEALPDTDLYNFYGPTETNVCCHWPVERDRLDGVTPIPIGLPAAGGELAIEPESGELRVRGPTLLSGYWSAGRLHPALDDEGWYRTADRVSLSVAGEYLFHGRLGRMLKCSGYRVEPAEIETALLTIPGVAECAVAGIADPAAGQRPAAALVLQPPLTIGEVQQALRAKLPAYMQPARFRLLDALPRLANGKLDRLALQDLMEVNR